MPTGNATERSQAPLVYAAWAELNPLVHLGATALCAFVFVAGTDPYRWLLIVPLICFIAWMNHVALTQLHEAAHGTLSRHRLVNELCGVLIGTFALTPLTVYRYVHARHHAHLGRERDPEFWPYSITGAPRMLRVCYAWIELVLGWLFTPALYSVRTAIGWRSVPRRLHRRLILEWLVMAAAWVGGLWVLTVNG
jgi:fatty acid desaturase